MSNRQLYMLAGALSALGVLLFLYKALVLDFPLLPDSIAQRWDIEAKLRFVARGGPAKVTIGIPASTRSALLIDEQFVSRGFGLSTKRTEDGRRAVWSRRQARGEQVLYYRATVQFAYNAEEPASSRKVPPLQTIQLAGSELAAAQDLLDEANAQSADTETLVIHLLKRLEQPGKDANATLLLSGAPQGNREILVASQLGALAGLPTRVAWGLELGPELLTALPQPLLQVFESGRWLTFQAGVEQEGMPKQVVILGYGAEPFVGSEGAGQVSVQWSVRRNAEEALAAALQRGRLLSRQFIDFSLFSLPLEIQQVYRVMLLIPLGVMLLVILRNVIGVKTFGTFMPVLIALAFRETRLIWGIVLFVVLLGLGLAIRFYLERLRLLLVPRLGSLLIAVVLMMALVSVLSHKLGLERGLSVALFPMVIITMTIERMSIVWEERGAGEAIQQAIGSLLAAVLGYLLMFNQWTEHVVFVFPELLLILLAGTLLLGRYTGYRLLELRRFKALTSASE